jgi:hypothetical protein
VSAWRRKGEALRIKPPASRKAGDRLGSPIDSGDVRLQPDPRFVDGLQSMGHDPLVHAAGFHPAKAD